MITSPTPARPVKRRAQGLQISRYLPKRQGGGAEAADDGKPEGEEGATGGVGAAPADAAKGRDSGAA